MSRRMDLPSWKNQWYFSDTDIKIQKSIIGNIFVVYMRQWSIFANVVLCKLGLQNDFQECSKCSNQNIQGSLL